MKREGQWLERRHRPKTESHPSRVSRLTPDERLRRSFNVHSPSSIITACDRGRARATLCYRDHGLRPREVGGCLLRSRGVSVARLSPRPPQTSPARARETSPIHAPRWTQDMRRRHPTACRAYEVADDHRRPLRSSHRRIARARRSSEADSQPSLTATRRFPITAWRFVRTIQCCPRRTG